MDQVHKMAEANSKIVLPVEKGLGIYLLDNQPKKLEKGLFLDAAIGSSGDAKDCGDFFHGGERM
eukprot:4376749-Ditylum_brightwellii.AAC.1